MGEVHERTARLAFCSASKQAGRQVRSAQPLGMPVSSLRGEGGAAPAVMRFSQKAKT